MKKVKTIAESALGWVLSLVALLIGATSGVFMAAATALPDAGKTASGVGGTTTNPEGIATESFGKAEGSDNFYLNDVDQRIVKIRPMATPVDQISRYAKSQGTKSIEVKYYSVGTRPLRCHTTAAVTAQTTGDSVAINVDDATMFTLDDTILVPDVKGEFDEKGVAYASGSAPNLVLCVCGKDSSGNPLVYAINGKKDGSGRPIWLPAIAKGATLVRMGKACGELDVQTGRFNNIPTAETQYCQNFMIQVEQSTFDAIANKEVNWQFSDVEEDGIYDMRMAMELTLLFGVKNVVNHSSKEGNATYFTGGIWYMAGNDIEVGEWDSTKGCAVVSDDNLVDIARDLFVGTGIGNKRKVLLCGSDLLAALSKIKSEKFRLKDTVEVWDLKFKSWDTDFGEILAIHHELFDQVGMSDCGFALDPEYLSKKTFINWTRNVLDLKAAGIRNTNAAVIQEMSCLYLRYPKAHARMRLAKAS